MRYDVGEISGLEKTAQGYIKAIARVTRTGVFTYRNADGSLRRELRHPDEVFSLKSLSTMGMLPITNLHPTEKRVNADNSKTLSIGFTGETITPDGKFIRLPILITDKAGVEAVENGRQELSLGYEVELEDKPGRYDSEEYDCIQRNIVYNHLAIVDRGRAGPDVRINSDGDQIIDDKKPSLQRSDSMVKLRLDNGCEYDVPQEVQAVFMSHKTVVDGLQTKLDAALKDVDKIKADADTAKDTAKELKTKVDGLPQAILDGVKSRLSLERTASKVLSSDVKIDTMSDADIRKAVITSKFPEAKLDGQTEPYIQARFDSVVEMIENNDDNGDNSAAWQRQVSGRQDAGNTDGCGSARKKMMDAMVQASETKTETK